VNEDKTERWKDLCKQVATERDPAKLLALVQEIDRLLETQGEWLRRNRTQVSENEGE
jgi:hypothetical protein